MNEKMSKLFNEVKSAANGLSEKANVAAELVKLNYSRSKVEQEINETYAQLGKVLYKSGIVPECAYADEMDCLCGELDALIEELYSIKDSINLVKGKVECRICGKTFPEGYQFCPNCGEALYEDEDSVCLCDDECCECEECAEDDAGEELKSEE